jgi:hypothetical protein
MEHAFDRFREAFAATVVVTICRYCGVWRGRSIMCRICSRAQRSIFNWLALLDYDARVLPLTNIISRFHMIIDQDFRPFENGWQGIDVKVGRCHRFLLSGLC